MPRRKNDLTPADTTGTPTDSSTGPRDSTPLPLPRPPSIPRPPRLPPPGPGASAKPSRRSETPSDLSMTAKIERVPRGDPTPAPLPPSPGARDAERWFEQVPTNPAAQPSGPADVTGSHRKSGRLERSGLHAGYPAPRAETPWLVMILIAAIALTIGMILGALIFSHGPKECDPCAKPGTVQPKQ
jgi:hypothetical protein